MTPDQLVKKAIDDCKRDDACRVVCRDCLESVIAEAVSAETERCAKLAEGYASECDSYPDTTHFCELFGCHNFTQLAAAIRGREK